MFISPSLGAYVGPELRIFRTDNAHRNIPVIFASRFLNGPVEDVADFHGPVVAGAQQVQRLDAHQRAYLVKCGRAAVEKKSLDHMERGRAQRLEYAESETLRNGRV